MDKVVFFLVFFGATWSSIAISEETAQSQSPKAIFPAELTERKESDHFVLLRDHQNFNTFDLQATERTPPNTTDLKANLSFSIKEQILEQYGDPHTPYPVHVGEKDHLPLGGLIKSLAQGEDELAFEYAKQFSDYRVRLSSLVEKATNYQIAALYDNGILSSDALRNPEVRSIAERFLPSNNESEELLIPFNNSLTSSLLKHLPKDLAERLSNPEEN